MGLRTALMEVRRARELDELDHMEGDLWDIALRAELGSLADAEAALAAAERALADALARGADQIEISALMDAFEQAMDRYMQLLMREAAEAGRFAEGGGGGNMSADMLEQLLEALREATELGDTEARVRRSPCWPNSCATCRSPWGRAMAMERAKAPPPRPCARRSRS